ncbi:MAG: TetR/AcrR family transcriptional regulator [Phycisphaeraceae bacterium]
MTAATPDPSWPIALPLKPDRAAPDREQDMTGASPRVSREALAASLRRRPRSSPGVLDRESILLATAACLDEVGYDGTTIRRIARELNCAVGSIYRYYADKRELLAAVCDRRFEAVRAAAYTANAQDFAELYLRVSRERPESYRLMFWLAALSPESDASAMPAVVREIVEAWASRLGSESAAQRMWFHLHGRATLGQDLQEGDLSAEWGDVSPLAEHATGELAGDATADRGRLERIRIVGLGEQQATTPAPGPPPLAIGVSAALPVSDEPIDSMESYASSEMDASEDVEEAEADDDLTLL